MCGIAGVWGNPDPPLVERMLSRIGHRGPDGRGFHSLRLGTIGHVRLAIMDPERGGQPMFDETCRHVLAANCEVYNHPTLRRELSRQHRFVSTSDAETIIHLFEELGNACFSRLDGMFALAIADDEHLVLARDPIGIKPLYYSWNGKLGPNLRLRFASELKALADAADPVRPLLPGTLFDTRSGVTPFSDLDLPELSHLPAAELASRIAETLRESVKAHLMSDVPVGVFLSGGLDSSVVAALMRPHLNEMHTFSVGTPDSTDLRLARLVARELDTIHHEYSITAEEVARELPAIAMHLESYDRYMVTNAIPNWFCAKSARDHVKVALIGEGSDEVFAGYDYFATYADPETLRRELHRGCADLHQTNLQRVDRMSMAHGVECRVPFVTPEMFALALAVPPEFKLREDRGRRYEKWILRKAFDGLLPDEIIWGAKRNFDAGSGVASILEKSIPLTGHGLRFSEYKRQHPQAMLGSPEEILFHKFLSDCYGTSPAIFGNVARWKQMIVRDTTHKRLRKPRRCLWKIWR